MPLESRCTHNTEWLLSHTHTHSPRNCPAFQFCILICLPSGVAPLPLASQPVWLHGCCHARVIRPYYEDICATLINEPVVLPLLSRVPAEVQAWVSHQPHSLTFALAPHQFPDWRLHTVVALRHPSVDSSADFTFIKSKN